MSIVTRKWYELDKLKCKECTHIKVYLEEQTNIIWYFTKKCANCPLKANRMADLIKTQGILSKYLNKNLKLKV